MKLVIVCHDKLHCSLTTTSKVVAGILVVLNWFFMGKWKWFFTDLFCHFLRFMSWESSEWPF